MNRNNFERWLEQYGEAWEAGDPEAVVRLFSATAAYYETPFDSPMAGREAIHRYWTEGARNAQTGVKFEATCVSFDAGVGFARWRAAFRRFPSQTAVELDGVLCARFDGEMQCTEFREWWHRREA